MNKFYFFKSEPMCRWLLNEIIESYPKYLRDPIEYNGKKVKFYAILNWVSGGGRGLKPKWATERNFNIVETIYDLPEGAGIYTTGYDANLAELEIAYNKGIPIIERPCLSMRELRNKLLNLNPKTHQLIFMIDDGHIIHECYKSKLPDDAIIVQEYNFEKIITQYKITKPIYLLVYPAFRVKDALKLIKFINENYPHPDNYLDSYITTRCLWSKQGLLEEIEEKVKAEKLDEIWIICSSEIDRSAQSVINEVKETGANYLIIKSEEDIPKCVESGKNIGVLRTPIPLTKNVEEIILRIKEKFA
jgi:4-hydroxy-3-methylbut-2-enyl diphosphate reductase IspH